MPIKKQHQKNKKFSVSKTFSKKQKKVFEKKIKLAKHGRRTKWAPVWIVLKKFGVGKRVHPSQITRQKRSWRRTKLHIKPRKIRKSHFG